MKFLLDTNVLIHLANRVPGHRRILKMIRRHGTDSAVVSAISAYEVHFKLAQKKVSRERLTALAGVAELFKVVPFNRAAAMEAARLRVHLEANGVGIGPFDTMIAGHAKALGLVCVTDNVAEFDRVPALKVENWLR